METAIVEKAGRVRSLEKRETAGSDPAITSDGPTEGAPRLLNDLAPGLNAELNEAASEKHEELDAAVRALRSALDEWSNRAALETARTLVAGADLVLRAAEAERAELIDTLNRVNDHLCNARHDGSREELILAHAGLVDLIVSMQTKYR